MNKTLFIDSALKAVEKSNASLKGALPDKWRTTNELTDDSRWDAYETSPVGNANYAWIPYGETLFIDARKIGQMISRKQKEFTHEDIDAIAGTYHSWRHDPGSAGVPPANAGGTPALPGYEDRAGYCKSATLEEIRKNDYVLTPGRYVGAPPLKDDGIPFETKMTEMSRTLYAQMAASAKLDAVIRENLEVLGYGDK